MTTWLFNPFKYVAGFKALVIGWIIILITAVIAYYGRVHFDGAIDVHKHMGHKIYPAWYYVAEPFIAWCVVVVVFYAAGRFFSSSAIRFIDIAGTMALSRGPFLFLALIHFMPMKLEDVFNLSAPLLIVAFLSVGFSIWIIALMYNAFKVAGNIKGQKLVWVFICSLLVAEFLSKVIFYYILF